MSKSTKFTWCGVAIFSTLAFSQTYKNPTAALEARIDDLASRMTLEEKISQLMNDSPAIDRLGIPAYNW
jgi:beta-glucosidase